MAVRVYPDSNMKMRPRFNPMGHVVMESGWKALIRHCFDNGYLQMLFQDASALARRWNAISERVGKVGSAEGAQFVAALLREGLASSPEVSIHLCAALSRWNAISER